MRARAGLRELLAFLSAFAPEGWCWSAIDVVAQYCSMPPSHPNASRCDFPYVSECCPHDDPVFSVWRRRKASDPLLLQRVLTYYPASMGSRHTPVATSPPMHQRPARFVGTLTVLRVSGIDQRSQTFKMHYRLRLMWRDCRLLHNCTWLSIADRHPLYKSIWTPPWRIEEQEGLDESMSSGRIAFSPEGDVTLMEERVGRFRCPFDFTDMPFDRQNCQVTLLVPQPESNVRLSLMRINNSVASVENVANAEWEIGTEERWTADEISITRELYNLQTTMSAVRWTFPLERRSRSMTINFIIPAIMFYLVSWLGLWIDPAAVPARAAIGTIPVLIMTNTLTSLAKTIPPISYPFKLENFLMATLIFIVFQMLEFGFVNYGLRRAKAVKDQAALRRASAFVRVRVGPNVRQSVSAGAQHAQEVAQKALRLPDRIAIAFGNFTDMHFRWVSLLAYSITSVVILAS